MSSSKHEPVQVGGRVRATSHRQRAWHQKRLDHRIDVVRVGQGRHMARRPRFPRIPRSPAPAGSRSTVRDAASVVRSARTTSTGHAMVRRSSKDRQRHVAPETAIRAAACPWSRRRRRGSARAWHPARRVPPNSRETPGRPPRARPACVNSRRSAGRRPRYRQRPRSSPFSRRIGEQGRLDDGQRPHVLRGD